MARLPRLLLPGFPVHLVVRGNDRQSIFRSEGDRIFFHRCLVETTQRFEVAVHAYVFMSNHVHLLATAARARSHSQVVQAMGRRYVSYFNFLHGRTGTLWEGRFRSSIVESDRYLLACQRYIERNPVRAGIVAAPRDYAWSSHRCVAGGRPDDLVTPHELVLGLGFEEASRRRAYRKLFDLAPDEKEIGRIRDALHCGWALGSADFCAFVKSQAGRPTARRPAGRKRSDAGSASIAAPRINSIGV